MSMETTTTGNIAEPTLRYTQAGKAVLELRIGATRRVFNKQTNEWDDDGSPLWVSASFWEQEAEHLAEILHKGSKVSVSGTVIREEYETAQGHGEKLVIRFPRFLGIVPKRQNTAQASQDRFSGPQSPNGHPGGAGRFSGSQGGVQDPAGNLGNVEQQFQQPTFDDPNNPPF